MYIEDRKKDMILVSGFNVYPNEVEAVAVTFRASSKPPPWRNPTSTPAKSWRYSWSARTRRSPRREVIECCRKSLAAYKVPKHVYFKPNCPRPTWGRY